MSLAPGPGRGGSAFHRLPAELQLVADKHVAYIQSLDTVRPCDPSRRPATNLLAAER